MKHTLKPQDKSTTAKKLTERKDPPMEEVSLEETPKTKGVNPILCNEKLMTAKTPGESCMCYFCYTGHSTYISILVNLLNSLKLQKMFISKTTS